MLYFIAAYVLFFNSQVSKKFFPELAIGFEDPRVHLHVGDGMILSSVKRFLIPGLHVG